jgi:hypothetical protein
MVNHMPVTPWTPEQASFFARKGAADRKARLKRLAEREAILDKLIAQAGEKAAEPVAQPGQGVENSYASQQVVILREQLARLHDQLRACDEPADILRLATAVAKLGEYEAQLAGRPSPGSMRPSARQARHPVNSLPDE